MKYNLANNEPLEINGDVYVKGVGTYDGTNSQTDGVKTAQTVITEKLDKTINITWSDLKTLRDNSKLIPGQKYRIIDYKSSAILFGIFSYEFDIVVMAISTNKLSSIASALHRDGVSSELDDYDLSAWKLKYSLDNDLSKFEWAKPDVDGKGVIYYLEDEFGNQAPYDFYSICTSAGPDRLFPWPYTGKSYNNTIRGVRDSNGRLKIPCVSFDEDVHDIEVSINSKGDWVAYNKADLFSTSIFDSENPSYPYSTYFIGEI